MLTGCLIEVLDILGHRRGGNGFPRFLYNQGLTAFLDTHLLGEHVHDNQQHNRSQYWIILNLIQLEDDESLVKERGLHVAVKGFLVLTALVEGGENGCIVVNIELGRIKVHLLQQLGNALEGELIEGIEAEIGDAQLFPAFLHLINAPVNLHQITILHGLRQETLNLTGSGNDLTLCSGRVIGKVTEFLNLLHRAVYR